MILLLFVVYGHPVDRAIDNHVVNLRLKIEPDPRHPIYFITKAGLAGVSMIARASGVAAPRKLHTNRLTHW